MSHYHDLVEALLSYSRARVAVRTSEEGSNDERSAIAQAAHEWNRVSSILAAVPQGSCPKCQSTYIVGCVLCGDDYPRAA